MKAHEWRYLAIAVSSSGGMMFLLGILIHPLIGLAWMIAWSVSYRNYPILHRLIEKMAGREEET